MYLQQGPWQNSTKKIVNPATHPPNYLHYQIFDPYEVTHNFGEHAKSTNTYGNGLHLENKEIY